MLLLRGSKTSPPSPSLPPSDPAKPTLQLALLCSHMPQLSILQSRLEHYLLLSSWDSQRTGCRIPEKQPPPLTGSHHLQQILIQHWILWKEDDRSLVVNTGLNRKQLLQPSDNRKKGYPQYDLFLSPLIGPLLVLESLSLSLSHLGNGLTTSLGFGLRVSQQIPLVLLFRPPVTNYGNLLFYCCFFRNF